MTDLTAHIMVRNEENWIGHILESAVSVMDHTIIVDTGSTDRTIAVINNVLVGIPKDKFTLIVCPPLTPKENGEMRQTMTDLTPTEWAIIIDGDEYYSPEMLKALKETQIPETAKLGFTLLRTLQYVDGKFWEAESWNKQATFHAKTTKWEKDYPWEGPSWYKHPETFFYYPGIEGLDFHHLARSSKDAETPHRMDNTRLLQPRIAEASLPLDLSKWPNPYNR